MHFWIGIGSQHQNAKHIFFSLFIVDGLNSYLHVKKILKARADFFLPIGQHECQKARIWC
jgi:hypothetical protein